MTEMKPKEREQMDDILDSDSYYMNDYGQLLPCERLRKSVKGSSQSEGPRRDYLDAALKAVEDGFREGRKADRASNSKRDPKPSKP